jgi:hypothetical protein
MNLDMPRLVFTQKFLPDRSIEQGQRPDRDLCSGASGRALHSVRAPTQGTVRPEIMARARKSIEKNRKLLKLLVQ